MCLLSKKYIFRGAVHRTPPVLQFVHPSIYPPGYILCPWYEPTIYWDTMYLKERANQTSKRFKGDWANRRIVMYSFFYYYILVCFWKSSGYNRLCMCVWKALQRGNHAKALVTFNPFRPDFLFKIISGVLILHHPSKPYISNWSKEPGLSNDINMLLEANYPWSLRFHRAIFTHTFSLCHIFPNNCIFNHLQPSTN